MKKLAKIATSGAIVLASTFSAMAADELEVRDNSSVEVNNGTLHVVTIEGANTNGEDLKCAYFTDTDNVDRRRATAGGNSCNWTAPKR